MRLIMRLLRDDNAAIEIEYGLCAAIFLVGVIAVLQLVGVIERL
jgi:Flp pilus assembly pilin Flp